MWTVLPRAVAALLQRWVCVGRISNSWFVCFLVLVGSINGEHQPQCRSPPVSPRVPSGGQCDPALNYDLANKAQDDLWGKLGDF